MSKEDDDLLEFKRILRELAGRATRTSDLGIKLLEEASVYFDDSFARRELEAKDLPHQQSDRDGWLDRASQFLKSQLQVVKFGPPIPDSFTRNFVEGLVRQGTITIKQWRLINSYRMIDFQTSGGADIAVPSSKCYCMAVKAITLLSVVLLATVFSVWEVVSEMTGGLFLAYAVGTLIGYLFRAAYDFAWGRAKLADYLHERMPWFNLRRCA